MTLFTDVRRKVLDNGLEILVREDRSAPVVALNFFVRVGSLNEDETVAGWSHGIEHMLFKGTARRGPGDIAREIENAGGDTNAGTGYESTNYYITLPAQNFGVALDIHADVLMHSAFDEFELEKERQVLIKENEMYRDQPNGYGFTWEHLLAEAFTVHRYRFPIGGPDANLLRAGRDEILAYKERYYVPNNIVYVIVGDVGADEAFRAVEEKLGAWPRRPLTPDLSPAEPPQTALRYRETTGDVEKTYVKIGFHVPPELHPDTDALLVLANVLGTGRASRLYQRVREERDLILNSGILEATGRDPGYLVVEFTAENDKADEALTEVLAQIVGFQTEPPTADELERTLRMLQGDTLHTLESMEGQASILGHYALLGDYRLAGTALERMAAVDAARVRDAARRHLNLEQATIYLHAPAGARPAPPAAREVHERLRAALAKRPAAGADAAASRRPSLPLPAAGGAGRGEVEAITLPSGARVVLQHDGRLPLVALAAYLAAGSGHERDEEAGVARLTQLCMLKGAGGRSAADIAGRLEGMGARLRPVSNRDVCGFSLGVQSRDLGPALDLLRTVLTRPDFPEEAVARERAKTLAELAALRDDTMQFTLAEFLHRLYAGHPYGRLVAGTEDSVRRLQPADLHAWHARVYDPSRLVLSVVGDFERDELLRRLEETAAALPGRGTFPAEVRSAAAAEGGRFTLDKEVSQAVVVVGYPGPPAGAAERYALEVWSTIMSGMGNRLFTRLRDERHLCYFTGTFVSPLRRGGAVGGYVGTGPEQVEEATEALLAELELSAREPVAEDELCRARNTLAGAHLIDMQTRMSWASTYAHDEVLGLGYAESLRYLDGIRAVTAGDVREAAAAVIDRGRLVVTALRPPSPVAPAGEETEE